MIFAWPDQWRDHINYGIYETLTDVEGEYFSDDDIPLNEAVRIVENAICEFIELAVLPLLDFGMDYNPALARELIAGTIADIDRHPLPMSLRDVVLDGAFWEILRETEDLLRSGLAKDATHRLRLVTRPKYKTLPHCIAAHAKATGDVYGPPAPQATLQFEDLAP